MQVRRKIGIVVLGASLVAGTVLAQQSSPSKPQYTSPAIAKYGKVVKFPHAVHQPRDGSKIVVDITKGGEPDQVNGAIEKVARFVNIYAGAGKEPTSARIAVVLHGDATLAILKPADYAKRFGTDGNPNLDCLRKLHEAGVEFLVCGQALTSQGGTPEEVVEFADVAVSGLTALVNLQQDGYSYVPLLK